VSGSLSGRLVLVADDNVDNAELLAVVLANAGAEVRTAATAREVLDLVGEAWTPDAILLDISLPDMTGYELLGAIRSTAPWQSIPAVAVTGHAYESDKDRATAAGFAAHIAKPFDGEAVVILIEKLVA
jgi:CheY-like chemotaxis protein